MICAILCDENVLNLCVYSRWFVTGCQGDAPWPATTYWVGDLSVFSCSHRTNQKRVQQHQDTKPARDQQQQYSARPAQPAAPRLTFTTHAPFASTCPAASHLWNPRAFTSVSPYSASAPAGQTLLHVHSPNLNHTGKPPASQHPQPKDAATAQREGERRPPAWFRRGWRGEEDAWGRSEKMHRRLQKDTAAPKVSGSQEALAKWLAQKVQRVGLSHSEKNKPPFCDSGWELMWVTAGFTRCPEDFSSTCMVDCLVLRPSVFHHEKNMSPYRDC